MLLVRRRSWTCSVHMTMTWRHFDKASLLGVVSRSKAYSKWLEELCFKMHDLVCLTSLHISSISGCRLSLVFFIFLKCIHSFPQVDDIFDIRKPQLQQTLYHPYKLLTWDIHSYGFLIIVRIHECVMMWECVEWCKLQIIKDLPGSLNEKRQITFRWMPCV